MSQHKVNQPETSQPEIREYEVKGMKELSQMEKKHLVKQLVRDRIENPESGPWEITDVRRGDWEAIGDALIQPVEIDLNDKGKDAPVRVWFDITQVERQIEAGTIESSQR
ncbi:hypothetical protein FTO70_07820 [Methanosarcina sp. KYL-1]|uniref:hypothetical protein n=1 Tax=Methanosarcina sp. KYL-1 TaxID=2602068 RepID=UPI0021015E0B|nr:hypothetical protein [Methanosarcina sp. KYL-1]MCQ1535586.1 hypothetical protein [Methanosarcina sp. KYL-1]